MKLTLNEKLQLIGDLENEGFSAHVIESIIDTKENPENCKTFETIKQLMEYLESHADEDDTEIECTTEGLPKLYETT